MHYAVYLPLILPLLAALAARPLADRMPPAMASWLLTGSALALAAASSAVLGLLTLAALVRIPWVASAGDLSRPVISQDDPAAVPVSIVAGALLAAAATAAARALYRKYSAISTASRHARSLPGTSQVVLTDDDSADAYTLPGWPCRVVVTAGMMRALAPAERDVLLAHERAHAAGFHFLFTTAARLAAAANPLLRPVATAVGYTVERWADERAAAETGDRPLAARAVARAALATKAAPPHAPAPVPSLPVIAAGPVVHNGVWLHRPRTSRPGPVPRRVAALLNPPPRPRLLLLATVTLTVLIAGASTLEAAHDMHALIEFARGTTVSMASPIR